MPLKIIRFSKLLRFFSFIVCVAGLRADTVDDIAETKENLKEVVELRQSLSTELRAWREQKEILEGQLRLDQQALARIEAQLAESRPLLESLVAESSQLETDLETYALLIEFWRTHLATLRQRLGTLVVQMHPGLKVELVPKYRDLDSIDLSGDLSGLRRAFDIYLEIITEANEYNSDIHLTSEIHERSDGKDGQFKVVYLGLSGGFYFSPEANQAGRIVWQPSQWVWVEENDLLDELMGLETVITGRDPPRFVGLPFAVKEEASQ